MKERIERGCGSSIMATQKEKGSLMKYKVRFIKDSERSDVSFVFEETELEAEDEAAARVAYEAAKSSAPEGALRIDLVRGEGYNWEKVAEDTL